MLRILHILCVASFLAAASAAAPCRAEPSESQAGAHALANPTRLAAPRSGADVRTGEPAARTGSDEPSGSFHPSFTLSLALLLGCAYLVVRRMTNGATAHASQLGRDSDHAPSGFNEKSVERAIAEALARRSDGL
jgi:hypothetical protein